jgi:multisubunit Na+/H+ antiporter MnhC subunit
MGLEIIAGVVVGLALTAFVLFKILKQRRPPGR